LLETQSIARTSDLTISVCGRAAERGSTIVTLTRGRN
jgi:hypothetical protein